MEGKTHMINAFRTRADEIELTRSSGRFRSQTSLDDGPESERRLVSQAVARAKAGDQEALRYLYVSYADNVYGYVRSIVQDDYEAEDVTQHAFAKLMVVLPKYEERGDVPFVAWILRVARNVALDHMRQRRPIPCEEIRGADEACDGDSHERVMMIKAALSQLPDDQREVVVLRHVVGLTPGEIADRLGKSEPSVHGLHHRGRGALRSVLSDLDSAPATRAA
jgi:RNA polymerase sigma-70 factor (ECF subfamily)